MLSWLFGRRRGRGGDCGRPPPDDYQLVHTFSFSPSRRRRHKSAETLPRSDSMVSLCVRNLVNYITDDNFDGLKNFLENKRVQVDDRDENGATALMVAAAKGKLQFVKEFILHDADVNAEDSDNWTALLCAAKEGYLDIVEELVEHNADIEHRDMGGWTALMWATYKGHAEVANYLLEKKAEVNAHGNYHISSLLWAAGRGHAAIAKNLIHHGAKVNVGDKYGTTALVWACRKGNAEIVDCLLKAGANVDTAGMFSWTPLLVATLGNHVDVVNLLLEHKPNVNALDKDGCTALTLACKEGFHEIAVALLNVGAYINIQDRAGDTNLIHAVKGGHRGVVEALLKKYADVDICGKDRKTAVYWAVEKGNVAMVKLLLTANPDLEIATKDGDTPLLRAVRIRNGEIVQLLLDKKAKVSAADKKGDTALHIAMRARSKGIVEVLLRNPKNSQLLYRPNRSGETPYNIDMNHQKTILGQIFGARRLNTNEDNENMLGYDLYSSALADILSEPSLSMPITVGLYAKWGSGKSFLLNKLREEMKNFAKQWVDPVFNFTSLLLLVVVHVALIVGVVSGLLAQHWIVGVSTGGAIVILAYTFLLLIWYGSHRYDWYWPYTFNVYLTRKLNSLKLVLQVMFCHPPGAGWNDGLTAQPIHFYFTDQTRVSSTTGGENSVVQMLGSLYDAIENDYGALATRLYRAFRPKSLKSTSSWKWRRLCCLPYFVIFELSFLSLLAGICVLTLYLLDLQSEEKNIETTTAQVILITIGLLLGVGVVANLYTWAQMLQAIFFSQRRHLQRAIARLDTLKSEGFLQALRSEVTLMTDMVKCLDSFTSQQTRLVVIVDGLDSCEQDKVLLVLDAVHMLFSDSLSPFIVILAIDPHVISKAVEVNSRRLFSESNIGGHDYLRNMVHLPFYLQNSGLRKVKVAQQTSQHHRKSTAAWNENEENVSFVVSSVSGRRLSSESGLSSSEKLKPQPPSRKGSRKLKLSESVASSLGSNLNRVGGAHDLTKMLLTDDYFSEVNPRSMRRLMNVVYITGRLLKAFQIDFNWYHLASWINITEQWPYRTSWLILYYDMFEDTCEDNMPLKNIYDKVRPQIPISKEMEPLLELDKDERKFDIFLTFHRSSLLISDLKVFLPFTINLDPYIKKVIKEDQQNADDMGLLLTSHFPTSPPTAPAAVINSSSAPPSTWGNSKTALLRRQRPLSRNSSLQSPSVPYPQHSVMNWPQPWMAMSQDHMPPMVRQPSYTSVPVTTLPMEVQDIKLSTLTVEGVCGILEKIEDLNPSMMSQYTTVIHDNNINGRVLLHCDLEELKKVLKMSFGDWEMFRMVITLLRETEMNALAHADDFNNKNVRFSVPTRQHPTASQERKGMPNKSTNQLEKEKPTRNENRSNKQTIMEKQVTLEEQMICGALQTLNEEACEDVLDETEPRSADGAALRSLTGSVPSAELPAEIAPQLRSGSCAANDGETEVLLLQSSPLHRAQPLAALSGADAAAAFAAVDGYTSGGGGSSAGGTPLQARRPPLPPAKEGSAVAAAAKSLLQRAGSSRSVSALSVAAKGVPSGGAAGGGGLKARQRPASLLVLGDVSAAVVAMTPPGSPKHHVAFRSHSAEDGSATVPTKTSSSTSLLSSLRGKKSNTSLNDVLLVTPASSLEKLNRLKDKLLRTVSASPRGHVPPPQGASMDGERDVELGLSERNGDLDSDDESTPLVSEISSPGGASASAPTNSSHFLNRGFSVAGASDSNSGSSENSPSSVKSTPLSSPPHATPAPKQPALAEKDAVGTNNGNVEPLANGLTANDNLAPEVHYASSCGSSVSLSQILEPPSNYYHLMAVSGSASSVDSDAARICARLSSQEALTDDDLKLDPRKASNHGLARQDALDNPGARASAKDSDDEWQNPETTV